MAPCPKSRRPQPRPARAARPLAAASLAAFAMAFAGCATHDPATPVPTAAKTIRVPVGQPWLDSGIRTRRGDAMRFEAKGSWGDAYGMYGPSGNPNIKKDHLGVKAPAFGLLMKINTSTNAPFFIGSQTNITATHSGSLMFRSNTSLPTGLRGAVDVRVTTGPDADGDRLSDYEEVHFWNTDPESADSNGNGFTDYEESLKSPQPPLP